MRSSQKANSALNITDVLVRFETEESYTLGRKGKSVVCSLLPSVIRILQQTWGCIRLHLTGQMYSSKKK